MIETRLKNARNEIEHWKEYDFVIVNDDLDRAFAEVRGTSSPNGARDAAVSSISSRGADEKS